VPYQNVSPQEAYCAWSITSNLVFSEWDRIFKDPMTTAAAIDRLVHHAIVLELTGKSIRVEDAQAERTAQGTSPPTNLVTPTNPSIHPIPSAAPTAPGSAPAVTTNEPGSSDD
jgi:hypothetical protein